MEKIHTQENKEIAITISPLPVPSTAALSSSELRNRIASDLLGANKCEYGPMSERPFRTTGISGYLTGRANELTVDGDKRLTVKSDTMATDIGGEIFMVRLSDEQ